MFREVKEKEDGKSNWMGMFNLIPMGKKKSSASSVSQRTYFTTIKQPLLTVLLGIVFLICQWLGFKDLWEQQGIKLKGVTGAGQFLYVIFGLHALHVVGGVIALTVLTMKAFFWKTESI